MNLRISWQLMLFLCAVSFRETLEKVTTVENPRSTGQQLDPVVLPAAWEQSPRRCAPERAEGSRQPGPSAARRLPMAAPRGPALAPRQRDLSAFRWNSFGLRYGRAGGTSPGRDRRRPGLE